MRFTGPVGVDGHASDGDRRRAGAVEEGTREPRDVVLLHGHVEVTLVQHVIVIIEGRDLQGDVALLRVEEGVQVELLLRARRDIDGHRLLAIDTAQTREGIERARATGIVEPHPLDISRYLVVRQHEATEGHDAVEGGPLLHRVVGNGHRSMIEERLGITLGVGELDLPQIGHRGIAIGAVAHDHQGVVARFQLEVCRAVICRLLGLVDLFHARTVFIVDGEVQASTDRGCLLLACTGHCAICRPGKTAEGRLFYLEDRDRQVGVFVSGRTADHTTVVRDGLLARREEKQECA